MPPSWQKLLPKMILQILTYGYILIGLIWFLINMSACKWMGRLTIGDLFFSLLSGVVWLPMFVFFGAHIMVTKISVKLSKALPDIWDIEIWKRKC
jgi:hypothetical protein